MCVFLLNTPETTRSSTSREGRDCRFPVGYLRDGAKAERDERRGMSERDIWRKISALNFTVSLIRLLGVHLFLFLFEKESSSSPGITRVFGSAASFSSTEFVLRFCLQSVRLHVFFPIDLPS